MPESGTISDSFLKLHIPVISELQRQGVANKFILYKNNSPHILQVSLDQGGNIAIPFSAIEGHDLSSLPQPLPKDTVTSDYLHRIIKQHIPFQHDDVPTRFNYKFINWNQWETTANGHTVTITQSTLNNLYTNGLRLVDEILASYVDSGKLIPEIIIVGESWIASRFSDNTESIDRVYNSTMNKWMDVPQTLSPVKPMLSDKNIISSSASLSLFRQLVAQIDSLYNQSQRFSFLDARELKNNIAELLRSYGQEISSSVQTELTNFSASLSDLLTQMSMSPEHQREIDAGISLGDVPDLRAFSFDKPYAGGWFDIDRPVMKGTSYMDVAKWTDLPAMNPGALSARPSAYDIDAFVVLQNDPVIIHSASKLATRSPGNAIVIYLDGRGNTRIVYQPPGVDLLAPGVKADNVRLSLLGHGYRGDPLLREYTASIANLTPLDLSALINQSIIKNSRFKNIAYPSVISLQSCMLVQNADFDSFAGLFTVNWAMLTGQFDVRINARTGISYTLLNGSKAVKPNVLQFIGSSGGITNSATMKYTFRLGRDGNMTVSSRNPSTRQKPTLLLTCNNEVIELWNDPTLYASAPTPEAIYHLYPDDTTNDLPVLSRKSYEYKADSVCEDIFRSEYRNTKIKINNTDYLAFDLYRYGILIDGQIIRPYRVDTLNDNITLDRVTTFDAFMKYVGTSVETTPAEISALKKTVRPLALAGNSQSSDLSSAFSDRVIKINNVDYQAVDLYTYGVLIDREIVVPDRIEQLRDNITLDRVSTSDAFMTFIGSSDAGMPAYISSLRNSVPPLEYAAESQEPNFFILVRPPAKVIR